MINYLAGVMKLERSVENIECILKPHTCFQVLVAFIKNVNILAQVTVVFSDGPSPS
jgi:hypothetical protein